LLLAYDLLYVNHTPFYGYYWLIRENFGSMH
jgi:hypothetical protein